MPEATFEEVEPSVEPVEAALRAETERVFTHGENPVEETRTGEVSDPLNAAQAVINFRAASVREQLLSTVALSDGFQAFKDDKAKLKQYLQVLVDAKLLTNAEIDNPDGARLSKLKTIAEHVSILLDKRIVKYLEPGYSLLYELILLWKRLPTTSDPTDRLRTILQFSDGPIKREWLKSQHAKPKPITALKPLLKKKEDVAVKSADAATEKPETFDVGELKEAIIEPPVKRSMPVTAVSPLPEKVTGSAIEPIVAVLMSPSPEDVTRLLADPSMWVGSNWLSSAEAVLLVEAKLGDLLAISDFVSGLSFARCSHIYLLSKPQDPDLITNKVLAVYERGGTSLPVGLLKWPKEKATIELANRLLDGVEGHRIHVFAESPAEGWESVVGDANWQASQ